MKHKLRGCQRFLCTLTWFHDVTGGVAHFLRQTNSKQWGGYAALVLLLNGCSSAVPMPWEDKFLDPGRIATREPLEIPPDLNTLPPANVSKTKEDVETQPWLNSGTVPQQGKQPATTASSPIRLPAPVATQDDSSISRNEQEKLPKWMK